MPPITLLDVHKGSDNSSPGRIDSFSVSFGENAGSGHISHRGAPVPAREFQKGSFIVLRIPAAADPQQRERGEKGSNRERDYLRVAGRKKENLESDSDAQVFPREA